MANVPRPIELISEFMGIFSTERLRGRGREKKGEPVWFSFSELGLATSGLEANRGLSD